MDWTDEGNKFYDECEFEKSLDCYKKAVEYDPSNVDALYNKALIHIILGEYEESLGTSDKLTEIVGTDPEVWKLKGYAHFNLKKYEEAVDAFDEAINLNPNDAYAWNNEGAALCNLGFFEKAVKSFEKAFSLDSKCLNALNNKKRILFFIEKQKSIEDRPDISDEHKESLKTERIREFRSYFQLAGSATDLGPGPEVICPVESCHYRVKLRIKGQRCPDHGVRLITAGS